MNRALPHDPDRIERWLLDEESWQSPDRLSESDLFAHASPGWRRGHAAMDDPEDER